MVQGIIENPVTKGLVPSFSLLVWKNGKIEYAESYPDFLIYDCASITKPLVTLPVVEAFFKYNDKVADFLEGFPRFLTVEMLLNHTSGFIPWLPLYLFDKPYLETIRERGMDNNRRKRYSCLNYITLAFMTEAISLKSFKENAKDFLDRFKGCFLPPLKCVKVAPTEKGNLFEFNLAKKFVPSPDEKKFRLNKVIRGETHDLNSHYKDGIAGNSGLFADVFGVCSLVENLLSIPRFYVSMFEKEEYFYHLGFTGTGIAVHKKRDTFVVFLSNRVCPRVGDYDFSAYRHSVFERCFGAFV